MARYGREHGAYDRQFGHGGTPYRRRYGGEYAGDYGRRGYDRGYQGGWGMTNLYNTIMHGGPRGRDRYGTEFYHRPSNTRYGWEFGGQREAEGGRRMRRSPDHDSVGVHYRGRYDRF